MRLRRIEGQVRGIARMVDDARSAQDILMQLHAVDAALSAVARILTIEHVMSQVTAAMTLSDSADQRRALSKIIEDITRLGRA